MDNKNKEENDFMEEIKRIKQSRGGEALLDHEIVVMLQVQFMTKFKLKLLLES